MVRAAVFSFVNIEELSGEGGKVQLIDKMANPFINTEKNSLVKGGVRR